MPGTTPVGLRVACECRVAQSLASVRLTATRYLVLRSARQILSCFSAPGTVIEPMAAQVPSWACAAQVPKASNAAAKHLFMSFSRCCESLFYENAGGVPNPARQEQDRPRS